MFNFEKLEVWKKAIDFAGFVYTTTRTFPDVERFGLTNPVRQAAVSISSNIAEGTSRHSPDDDARVLEIATGSEVVSQSFIAQRQGHWSEENRQRIYAAAGEQSRKLSGLRRSPGVA